MTADLSPAMRAELVTAARRAIEGLYVVVCHEHTRKALIRRGLAEEQHIDRAGGLRTVLTREGRQAAARVVGEDNPALKPGTTDLDIAKVTRVMRQFDTPEDPEWCGWRIDRSNVDPGHVLITCDVPDDWARTMPGGATRQGIAQSLTRYATALREVGFGTATWKWGQQPHALIVAPSQAVADEIAPGIRKYLTGLNPEEPAKGDPR